MALPHDYLERVYAGTLGKIIGVYLGRPFEGWTYERIMQELGEIWYYVNEKRGVPLIVTDDDISGTFTFVRALPDHGNRRDITAAEIGRTWLNYLIENRTILWWGGLGNSTEHTAYLRLKHGVEAPASGSIELNGKVVAEQIGAQIFIDGWAMVAPGDPALATDLARRAGSVSHDGEALYGAQVVAALESQAFVESDLNRLLDTALSFVPGDSLIYRLIGELRELRGREPDWRQAFQWLKANYGYDKYGGNCHMIPNHGLIILSLLYGDDSFQKSLMVVNTCGWDTDCNSANVGCIMGIKNGLAGIDAGPDYRGPVADRLYLPTAEGGSAVTDAAIQAVRIANIGRALAGEKVLAPKGGMRFHFELPGAVQGFVPEQSIDSAGTTWVANVAGHSARGSRSLAINYAGVAHGRPARAATATWLTAEAVKMPGYGVIASPTLYPGQVLHARVEADLSNGAAANCRMYLRFHGPDDTLERAYGPEAVLDPGAEHVFDWTVPEMGGYPIAEVGLEIATEHRTDGTIYLDYLGWEGTPTTVLTRPSRGHLWQRAWVNGVSDFNAWAPEAIRLVQNEGTGLIMQGTREWRDYRVTADVTPHMVEATGIAARVQGLRRYYALQLARNHTVQLIRLVDVPELLAESPFEWAFGETHTLALEVRGTHLEGRVDGEMLFELNDTTAPDGALADGGIGLVVTEGRTATQALSITALG